MWNIPRVLLVVSAAVLVLAGCVQRDAIVTPAPVSSATPMFANEQDALAAAEKAYAAYVKLSDRILQEGGAKSARIAEVVTGGQLKAEISGYKTAVKEKIHSEGDTRFENIVLQQFDSAAKNGKNEVSVYVCEDISGVDVVDSSGTSVVKPGRRDRVRYEVKFDQSATEHTKLLVSSKEVWSGDSC